MHDVQKQDHDIIQSLGHSRKHFDNGHDLAMHTLRNTRFTCNINIGSSKPELVNCTYLIFRV